MTKSHRKAAALCAASLLSSGCGTLGNGSTQLVDIASDPPGASVEVNGKLRAVTPAQVTLSRKGPHDLRIFLAGHADYRIRLHSVHNAAITLDAFVPLAGLLFIVIDLLSGGAYDLYPSTVEATLVPDP